MPRGLLGRKDVQCSLSLSHKIEKDKYDKDADVHQ
jgi:hypothetical protein